MVVLRRTLVAFATVIATIVVSHGRARACGKDCYYQKSGYDGCDGSCGGCSCYEPGETFHYYCPDFTVDGSRGGRAYDCLGTVQECHDVLCVRDGVADPTCCAKATAGANATAEAKRTELREDADYGAFFAACMILVLLLEVGFLGYLLKQDNVGPRSLLLLMVVGIRSFDMMSDWAFFAISLRPDSSFAAKYDDHEVVRGFCGLFATLGLIMWIPDLIGYFIRVAPDEETRVQGRSYVAKITAAVILLEDMPQLSINCVYLGTMGFNSADPVAIFSFAMSILSLTFNMVLGFKEARAVRKANMSASGQESIMDKVFCVKRDFDAGALRLSIAFVLVLCLVFAIVVPAHNGLFEAPTRQYGIWKYEYDGETHDQCSEELSDDANDCAKAVDSKCKTMQAFSILGVLSTAAALGLTCVDGLQMAGAGMAAFGSFSYLIIWCVAASLFNAESRGVEATCGIQGYNEPEWQYGASFGIAITNWVLLFGTVIALVKAQLMPAGSTAGWNNSSV